MPISSPILQRSSANSITSSGSCRVPGWWEAGEPDGEGGFEVAWQGRVLGRLTWQQMGAHNRMNALAAVASARHVGVEPAQALEALGSFSGVRRRMQVKGSARGDDLR